MSKYINYMVKMFFATKSSEKYPGITRPKKINPRYGSISELEPLLSTHRKEDWNTQWEPYLRK